MLRLLSGLYLNTVAASPLFYPIIFVAQSVQFLVLHYKLKPSQNFGHEYLAWPGACIPATLLPWRTIKV